MKTRIVIPVLFIVGFVLSGCSSNDAAPTEISTTPLVAPVTSTAAPSKSPTAVTTLPVPKTNERDQIIKSIGEIASIIDQDSAQPQLSFKVTAIEPLDCTAEILAKQPAGTALAVHLQIETTADFIGPLTVNGTSGQISFGPYYWKGYMEDGVRMNTVDSGYRSICISDPTLVLPDYIGKGEKIEGIVVLDVSTPTGSIAYSPWGDAGWIWTYPTS